jgi:hypothetical protein
MYSAIIKYLYMTKKRGILLSKSAEQIHRYFTREVAA